MEAVELNFYTKKDYTPKEWENRLKREEDIYFEQHEVSAELLERMMQRVQQVTQPAQEYTLL